MIKHHSLYLAIRPFTAPMTSSSTIPKLIAATGFCSFLCASPQVLAQNTGNGEKEREIEELVLVGPRISQTTSKTISPNRVMKWDDGGS